jgi:uncharacterized protein (DUF1800 family)
MLSSSGIAIHAGMVAEAKIWEPLMIQFMHRHFFHRLHIASSIVMLSLLTLAGCATNDPPASGTGASTRNGAQVNVDANSANALNMVNRVTWGANASTMQHVTTVGLPRYMQEQLAAKRALPPEIAGQISAMTIAQKPLAELVQELEQRRKDADANKDDDAKKMAQQAYQAEMNRLAREASTRTLLRAVYSPNQLQEQMVWFWMNHFSIHAGKHNNRAMIGDFEESAIRPYALGKFRDLVAATVFHPAMIRYLDNEQNAANRINENYARELMELHTLGVDGGYTQKDVQELARILTGVGVNLGANTPNVRKELAAQYVRKGLFEFNPNRHDYGDKVLLGQPIKGRGLAEVEEAITRLSKHPSTARFVSRKLALHFVSDDPPVALVERMAAGFTNSDGDIAATLRILLESRELSASLGKKFKAPIHYVVSAVRLAYDEKPILNAGPMLNWLNRMGQPMFGRQSPDGYSLVQTAWASPGQMTTRFEIAKAIGSGSAGLFRTDGPQPVEKPAFPQLANALYFGQLQQTLSPTTRQALDQAASPQEWNMLLMASPEMMHR